MSDERTREELFAEIANLQQDIELQRHWADSWARWAAIFFIVSMISFVVAIVLGVLLLGSHMQTSEPELAQPIDDLCRARASQRERQEEQEE